MHDAFVVVPAPRSLLLQFGPSTAAGAGPVLVVTTILFDAPTSCVVTDADVPATEVLFVVNASRQEPGVLVEVMRKVTTPDAAVPVALPEVGLDPPPPTTPLAAVMLQMFAEDVSRVAVITVELSAMFRLPFVSLMLTVAVEVDTLSAAIGLGLNDAEVLADAPGALVVAMALQPVALPDVGATETCALPAVVVVVYVAVATPLDGVTVCVPVGVMVVGVTFVKLSVGVLAFETVLPFESLSVAV